MDYDGYDGGYIVSGHIHEEKRKSRFYCRKTESNCPHPRCFATKSALGKVILGSSMLSLSAALSLWLGSTWHIRGRFCSPISHIPALAISLQSHWLKQQ